MYGNIRLMDERETEEIHALSTETHSVSISKHRAKQQLTCYIRNTVSGILGQGIEKHVLSMETLKT